MHACPDTLEFDRESRRLLNEIHQYDVLRSDKCISSHGLEPRTPFLDREFVQRYLSIPPMIRYHGCERHGGFIESDSEDSDTGQNQKEPAKDYIEKSWLRVAFDSKVYSKLHACNKKPYLPYEILWRRKEAFSDGVSHKSRSLFEMIGEHTERLIDSKELEMWKRAPIANPPSTTEQVYYRKLFEGHYPRANILSHFWMPKYVKATDASARTLALYHTGKQVTFSEEVDVREISRISLQSDIVDETIRESISEAISSAINTIEQITEDVHRETF